MAAFVRQATIAEIMGHPDFRVLVAEYEAESAIKGLPPTDAKMATYLLIEKSGALYSFAAFVGETFVGFVVMLAPIIPHYGISIAVAESLFVTAPARPTGAGIMLIRAAERKAQEIGSPAILFSAPSEGRLSEVLPGIGYRETGRTYTKVFHHE